MTAQTPRQSAATRLLEALNDALFAQGLGSDGASRRQERLADAVATLETLRAGDPQSSVSIELHRLPIRVDGQDLHAPSLRSGRMRRLAEERGTRGLLLRGGTTVDQLGIALDLLGEARPGVLADDRDGWRNLHRRYGLDQVELLPLQERTAGDARGGSPAALDDLQELTSQVEDNHLAAAQGDELGLDETRSVVERAAAALEESPSELLGLATYDDIDRFTVGHSVRVALLAMHTAGAAGHEGDSLQRVGTAALLHDIGKSLVPAQVLFKRGKLEPEEWAAMREHPRLGAQILVAQGHIDDCAVGAAFCHHLRPDGGGYPQALMTFRPGSVSGLVRICDVFEALTAVRPYKHGMAPAEALAIMHRDPGEFDQTWLRHFAITVGPFPVGSGVELEDGTVARVLEHGPQRPDGSRLWDRPRVVLPDGTELDLATGDAPPVLRPALPGVQLAVV